MAKALLKQGRIDNAVNVWTRHATPQPICHMILSGASGKAFLSHVDETAPGLFVFGHPTLGDWSTVPAAGKTDEGHALHRYSGSPESPPDPMTAEAFATLNVYELFFRGHLTRIANGTRRDGVEFCGFAWTGLNTFRDALTPSSIAWETGEDWGAVSDLYKDDLGNPRIDPDEGIGVVAVFPSV